MEAFPKLQRFRNAYAGAEARAAHVARSLVRKLWSRGDIEFIAYVSLLVGSMIILRPLFSYWVPRATYGRSFIAWQMVLDDWGAIRRATRTLRPAAPAFLFLLFPTLLHLLRRERVTWEHFEGYRGLRWVIMAIIACFAWAGATFDYNMYLDQGHFLDRALLLIFGVLSWRSPLFVPFFTKMAIVMMREWSFPLFHDDFDWRAATGVLVLFSGFVWLSFLRGLRTVHFVFGAICLLGSYYYYAGKAKLMFGTDQAWLWENELSNLFVNSWVHGWVGFLPQDAVVRIANVLHWFDVPFQLLTVFIEFGFLLVFVHPLLTRVWLFLAAALHSGIFLMTGILFWKWIVTDAMLLWFVSNGGRKLWDEVFRYKAVQVFGVLVIMMSPHWGYFRPQIGVAWWDTPYNETYNIYVTGVSGKQYLMAAKQFAPLDTRVTQENMHYLSTEPYLTGVYGTSYNYRLYKELYKLRSADDAAKLRRTRGRNRYKETTTVEFGKFVRQFLHNTNKAEGKKHQWLGWIGKPEHLMTWPVWTDYDYQEPVVHLEVWREATFFDRNDIQSWGETKLFETSIEHPGYKNPNPKIDASFQAPAPTRPTGRVLLRDWFRPAPVPTPNLDESPPDEAH